MSDGNDFLAPLGKKLNQDAENERRGSGSGGNSGGNTGGEGCLGKIVLLIIVFAVLVAAWQDPSGQGKFCLGLIGLVIAGYVFLRRRRTNSSKPDSRTSF